MANQIQSLDSVFHALADPTRRAVISRLLDGAAPVKRLSEPFQMGLPAFLKHLSVLEASGLIHTEKQGRVRTCRVDAARLAAAEGWLAEQRALWPGRTARHATCVASRTPPGEPP